MLIYLQNAWHSRVDVGREAVAVIIAVLLSILRGGGRCRFRADEAHRRADGRRD